MTLLYLLCAVELLSYITSFSVPKSIVAMLEAVLLIGGDDAFRKGRARVRQHHIHLGVGGRHGLPHTYVASCATIAKFYF